MHEEQPRGGSTVLGCERISLVSPRRRRTEKVAHRIWREDVEKRNHGQKTFRISCERVRPQIREAPRRAPKGQAD